MSKFYNEQQLKNSPIIMSTVEEWDLEKFLLVPAYQENRAIDRRIKKVIKNMKLGLPTMYEVKVFYTLENFGNHPKNTFGKLDGNARTYVWMEYPELRTQDKVMVTIYFVRTEEEARMLYESIDSSDSAENASDKVTGYIRKMGYDPKTTRLKKGNINTALRLATRYAKNSDGIYLMATQLNPKMEYFWDQIKYLDEVGVFDMKKASNNVLSSLLLVGKKYGVDNPKYKELVFKFHNEIPTITSDLTNDMIINSEDGVTFVYNTLFSNHTKDWKNDSFDSIKEENEPLNCRILYSFDCFMNNIRIKKRGRKSMTNSDFFAFWQNYLK